jgi:hypothetical protein
MRVQFDLRPAGLLEKERKQKSFNLTRTIAIILMLLFFGSSSYYLVMMTLHRIRLEDVVSERESMIFTLETEKSGLERQVNELKAREKVFADTLKIMQDDLPTIEVLDALETNMDDYGIGFNSLRFVIGRVDRGVKAPDVVEVTGLVASDKQIIDFSDRLRAAGVFSDVFLPVTTRNDQTGMISFTLRMPVYPIGQIRALR